MGFNEKEYMANVERLKQKLIRRGYSEKEVDQMFHETDKYCLPTSEWLYSLLGPKEAMVVLDILSEGIDEPDTTIEVYDDDVDLREMNKWLKEYVLKVDRTAPKQFTYVIEEISELVTELMALEKVLIKEKRAEASEELGIALTDAVRQPIFEEACDVIAAILMMFVRDRYHLPDILPYITSKYKRAVERFDENKNV